MPRSRRLAIVFVTTLPLLLGAIAILEGWRESRASTGELGSVGLSPGQAPTAQLKTAFEETKACTRLSKGSFEEATVVVVPARFGCRWYDGTCSGEFVPPTTIKLGSAHVWKHEVIHFLLYRNTGRSDPNHESPLFRHCSV